MGFGLLWGATPVWVLGAKVWIYGLGFRVWGLGFRVKECYLKNGKSNGKGNCNKGYIGVLPLVLEANGEETVNYRAHVGVYRFSDFSYKKITWKSNEKVETTMYGGHKGIVLK